MFIPGSGIKGSLQNYSLFRRSKTTISGLNSFSFHKKWLPPLRKHVGWELHPNTVTCYGALHLMTFWSA